MKKCIMAVGAHADDIEGNAGGTILKYKKLGYDLVYVMSTNNMSGSWQTLAPDGSIASRNVPWFEIMPQRKIEAAAGAALFNAPVFHLNHPQRHCRDREGVQHYIGYGTPPVSCVAADQHSILTAHESADARKAVAELVKRFQPEVVMTHDSIQLDMEHIGTSLLVTRAMKECGYKGMVLLWPCVDVPFCGEIYNFRQSYIDISDYYKGKLDSIAIHKCQMPKVSHLSWRPWEKGTGCKHVEAYAVVQEGISGGELRDEILKNRQKK
ncbi:MAG: PIG-L family deacetylase [Kiritimatiellia bacterium]